jgi:hypothetical protein
MSLERARTLVCLGAAQRRLGLWIAARAALREAPDDCLPATLRLRYHDALTQVLVHSDMTDRNL